MFDRDDSLLAGQLAVITGAYAGRIQEPV